MSWTSRIASWLSTRLLPEPDNSLPTANDAAKAGPDGAAKVAQAQYQLQLDKLKAKDQYRYAWSQSLWDKGCFTLVGAIIAGIFLFGVNYLLERYKLEEARRRALLAQQLDELFKLNTAFSKMTSVYFAHAGEPPPADEKKIKKEYEEAAANTREAINRSQFLFDVDFDTDVDRYSLFHRKMSQLPIKDWGEYRKCAADLSTCFDEICKSVIQNEREKPASRARMPLADISYERRIEMTPKEYVDKHKEHWEEWKKKGSRCR
jgi:hypothetical protein